MLDDWNWEVNKISRIKILNRDFKKYLNMLKSKIEKIKTKVGNNNEDLRRFETLINQYYDHNNMMVKDFNRRIKSIKKEELV